MRVCLISLLILIAQFAFASNVTLTVINNGSGAGTITARSGPSISVITCSNVTSTGSCSRIVPGGTEIVLNATPEGGATFVNFNSGSGSAGGCNGASPTCTFIINQNSTIKYSFGTGQPLQMTVQFTGTGTGLVNGKFLAGTNILNCTSNCQNNVNKGTVITLTGTPPSTSTFTGWGNGTGSAAVCNGVKGQCKFVMTQASSVMASFTKKVQASQQ